jgi:hypothetical protein
MSRSGPRAGCCTTLSASVPSRSAPQRPPHCWWWHGLLRALQVPSLVVAQPVSAGTALPPDAAVGAAQLGRGCRTQPPCPAQRAAPGVEARAPASAPWPLGMETPVASLLNQLQQASTLVAHLASSCGGRSPGGGNPNAHAHQMSMTTRCTLSGRSSGYTQPWRGRDPARAQGSCDERWALWLISCHHSLLRCQVGAFTPYTSSLTYGRMLKRRCRFLVVHLLCPNHTAQKKKNSSGPLS